MTQMRKAQKIASHYQHAIETGNEELATRHLRAYERLIAKLGTDPLA